MQCAVHINEHIKNECAMSCSGKVDKEQSGADWGIN